MRGQSGPGLPKRSASRREKPMSRIMQTMPLPLNGLKAEVAASSGHWNPVRPKPVSAALRPVMKPANPEASRNDASAASLKQYWN